MGQNFAYNESVVTFAMPNNGKAMLSPMSTVNAHDIRRAFFMPLLDNCINNTYGCLSCVMFLLFGEKAYYCLATREMTAVFLSKKPNNSKYMDSLVFQNNAGNDVTTSLIVAEVFGKEHSKVVRDIENLSCSITFNTANFGVIEYTDSRGRTQKAYEMTKDGFSFLVMGYTGEKAGQFKEKFINEFNKRERMLKDDDYILMRSQQILQRRIEAAERKVKELEATNASQQETISIQASQIKESAPKVKVYDNYISSTGTYTATQIAKEYGWGAETLNKKLRDMGIQYKQNGQWLLYAKYDGKDYTKSIPRTYTKSDGSTGTQMQTVWTSKGREFIHTLF